MASHQCQTELVRKTHSLSVKLELEHVITSLFNCVDFITCLQILVDLLHVFCGGRNWLFRNTTSTYLTKLPSETKITTLTLDCCPVGALYISVLLPGWTGLRAITCNYQLFVYGAPFGTSSARLRVNKSKLRVRVLTS